MMLVDLGARKTERLVIQTLAFCSCS